MSKGDFPAIYSKKLHGFHGRGSGSDGFTTFAVDTLIDYGYTVVKVDGATPKRWISKGL